MIIKVNGIERDADKNDNAGSIKRRYKENADIIIINGFPADEDTILREGDNIVLIKTGEIPENEEFEASVSARHTPGVYDKLKSSSCAIAGIGGLGSNAAVSLARMGVGHINIVDYDVVDITNINRQYYDLTQLGMKKTEALKNTIKKINPLINIKTEYAFVTDINLASIFKGYEVILECFDRSEVKESFIVNSIRKLPESFIIGSSGVAGIYSHELFKVRKLGKKCVMIGDFENEAAQGTGLMATRAAIAANIMANIAVRYLLGESI